VAGSLALLRGLVLDVFHGGGGCGVVVYPRRERSSVEIQARESAQHGGVGGVLVHTFHLDYRCLEGEASQSRVDGCFLHPASP